MLSSTSKTAAIRPRQTMRGHTDWVNSVVHLRDGRIITCSWDGSLRLWDLESGTQIDEDWRDDKTTVWCMVLSPNGKIIASGGDDGKVRLWDVETRKVIKKCTGHTKVVCALCWSGDGERVTSASWDGTARVWDVNSGQTIFSIETGHGWVRAVIYSPDSSKLVTGGGRENAVTIWDAKMGKLLTTLKHDHEVRSLAWTSDGQKLISGSNGPIRIFDTATWKQIAILEGHISLVTAISLSHNNRLLASASWDRKARLWNLDTNLPIGPPLHHENILPSAALSLDGKVLVTGCKDKNAYTWDVHAILKKAHLEDLLPSIPHLQGPTRKSLVNSNAMQHPPIQARRIPQGFFNGMQNGAQSSAAHDTHPRSPAQRPRSTRAPLLERFSSLFRHSRSDTDGAMELQQRPTQSIFSRGPPIVQVSVVRDKEALFVAQPAQKTQQQAQSHSQGSSTTLPAPGTNAATPGAKPAHSQLVRLLAHLVLFLCCASPQHATQPTQQQSQGQVQTHAISLQAQHQQGQSQGQPQTQASSPQTQPAAPSTSATPTALNAHTTAPGAASRQPRPLPLRTRFVLFLCCASLPHEDGH